MTCGEVWRRSPVDQLLVSSEGRVLITPHTGVMPNGGVRHYECRASFGTWQRTEHRFVFVYRGHTYKVARLVCEAFHGQPPVDRPVCMHLDENPANNRPDNLRWGTQKENLNAPGFLEYCRGRKGDASPTAKARQKAVAQ